MKNKNTFSELCLTIAALTVRHEFCVQVEEAGGLEFIFNGMVSVLQIPKNHSRFRNYVTCHFRESIRAPYGLQKNH